MKKIFDLGALVLVGVLAFSGCGKGDTSDNSQTPGNDSNDAGANNTASNDVGTYNFTSLVITTNNNDTSYTCTTTEKQNATVNTLCGMFEDMEVELKQENEYTSNVNDAGEDEEVSGFYKIEEEKLFLKEEENAAWGTDSNYSIKDGKITFKNATGPINFKVILEK